MAFSNLREAASLIWEDVNDIEFCIDMDTEKETTEEGETAKFTTFKEYQLSSAQTAQPTCYPATEENLVHISYEVEVLPPQA